MGFLLSCSMATHPHVSYTSIAAKSRMSMYDCRCQARFTGKETAEDRAVLYIFARTRFARALYKSYMILGSSFELMGSTAS